jgi:hypothetical protein
MTREADPAGVQLFQAPHTNTMTIYTGKMWSRRCTKDKMIEVLYVPWIWQWCSILCNQADPSSAGDLRHPERTKPVKGELVCAFTGEYAPEH